MSCVIMALVISSGTSEECGILQLTVTHLTHTHQSSTAIKTKLAQLGAFGGGAWLALPFVELGFSYLLFHFLKRTAHLSKLEYK